LAPAKKATWTPPAPLEGLVERAYVQEPFLFFESAIPPQVAYHHLRVPGDLTLLMTAAKVHRQGTTGKGVKVAMIDSGFYLQHPFYQGMSYNMSCMLGPGATDLDHDENGHGTAEASNMVAIAPDITFIGVKVGDNLAASFKETVKQNPDIISISLGWDLRGNDGAGVRNRLGRLIIRWNRPKRWVVCDQRNFRRGSPIGGCLRALEAKEPQPDAARHQGRPEEDCSGRYDWGGQWRSQPH
jgi:hypothetical protein